MQVLLGCVCACVLAYEDASCGTGGGRLGAL